MSRHRLDYDFYNSGGNKLGSDFIYFDSENDESAIKKAEELMQERNRRQWIREVPRLLIREKTVKVYS